MKYGRRRSLIFSLICGIVGNVVSSFSSIYMVNIGRFIFGFASGLTSSIIPKYLTEVIPTHLYGAVMAGFTCIGGIGSLIATFVGGVVKDGKNPHRDWILLYLYIPVSLQLLGLLGMIFVVNFESIKFLMDHGEKEEALKVVKKIYKHANTESMAVQILDEFNKSNGKAVNKVSMTDAMFNPRYRRSTWINVVHMMFHEFTGINVISLYSGEILKSMQGRGGGLSVTTGVYMIMIAGFVAHAVGILTVKFIGRKTLLIWGHISMALIHAGIGMRNVYKNDNMVIILIIAFMFAYGMTTGPVAWVYAAETVIDSAMGITLFSLWGTVFLLSIICPPMMHVDSVIGPENTFFIFAGISVFGAFYAKYFIIETFGKTNKEKMQLFTPAEYIDNSEDRQEEESITDLL